MPFKGTPTLRVGVGRARCACSRAEQVSPQGRAPAAGGGLSWGRWKVSRMHAEQVGPRPWCHHPQQEQTEDDKNRGPDGGGRIPRMCWPGAGVKGAGEGELHEGSGWEGWGRRGTGSPCVLSSGLAEALGPVCFGRASS